MNRTTPILAVAIVLTAGLAGCIGGQGDEIEQASNGSDAAEGLSRTGNDLARTGSATEAAGDATGDIATTLTADDAIDGPDWEVGQWFGYHVFFGMEDDEGIHYNAIVVEDQGSSWLVATDNQDAAKFEAIFDLEVLGQFNKDDLSTTLEGEPFTWYEWPLQEGATWTRNVNVGGLMGDQSQYVDVTFEVAYNPSIPTTDGNFPGFDVIGRTAEGNLTVEYDYVPAIGWFGHLFVYDPASNGDEWVMHIMTMGSGTDWSGTYYVDDAQPLFEHASEVGVNPFDPTSPTAEPGPHASGTVSDGATYVTGYVYSYAFTGVHDVELVDPNHERHQFHAMATPMGFAFSFGFIDVDAVPGQWELVMAGAGGFVGGGAYVWEVTEQSFELGSGV